jgi:hypothetical protein
MKMSIFILLLFITISCDTPQSHYLLKTDCPLISSNEFFNQLKTLLIKEKFKINEYDSSNGYLIAESLPVEIDQYLAGIYGSSFFSNINYTSYTNGYSLVQKNILIWEIHVNDKKVIGEAKELELKNISNMFVIDTITNYVNENTLSVGDIWYWDIKKGMEEICGNKIVIEKELVKTVPKPKKPFGERLY